MTPKQKSRYVHFAMLMYDRVEARHLLSNVRRYKRFDPTLFARIREDASSRLKADPEGEHR